MSNDRLNQPEKREDPSVIDWQDVYRQSLPGIFHYCCYRVGDAYLAEELTSTTFEKAWCCRAGFRRERGEAHAWLTGIARNVIADHFRKINREVAFEESAFMDWGSSPEDDVQRRLDFQVLQSLLTRFPERERELIALKYGAELNNRQIARMTGLSESNVGTILHRSVEKLRTAWEEYDE